MILRGFGEWISFRIFGIIIHEPHDFFPSLLLFYYSESTRIPLIFFVDFFCAGKEKYYNSFKFYSQIILTFFIFL